MIKGGTHAHAPGPIWYHSEPADVPFSPNQILALNLFCRLLQQDCYSSISEVDYMKLQNLHFLGLLSKMSVHAGLIHKGTTDKWMWLEEKTLGNRLSN